jgi:hypothetical protein
MSDLHPEKYRHDLEVVRNTAFQVIKDFGLSGIEITFSGSPQNAYEELLLQVQPALRTLYKESKSTFMSLLYRIDVDEKKVMKLAENESSIDFFGNLTKLVIEREFTKVLIRKLYSSRNG